MAISTRSESSGGNAFTLARMLVPTGPMPIAERFAAINEAVSQAREQSKNASLDTLATMSSLLPTSVLTRIARAQSQTVDFATSNVRGAGIGVGELPNWATRRRCFQPDHAQLQPQLGHGTEHRHGRSCRTRTTATVHTKKFARTNGLCTSKQGGHTRPAKPASYAVAEETAFAVSNSRTSSNKSATSSVRTNSRLSMSLNALSITLRASVMTAVSRASVMWSPYPTGDVK